MERGLVLLLILSVLTPLSAQDTSESFWDDCETYVNEDCNTSVEDCCSSLTLEADTSPECFCHLKSGNSVIQTLNPTFAAVMRQFASTCEYFDPIPCPADSTPTSGLTPVQTPDTPVQTPNTPVQRDSPSSAGTNIKIFIGVIVVVVAVVISIVVGSIYLCCRRKPKPYAASYPQTGPNIVNYPYVEPYGVNPANVESNVQPYGANPAYVEPNVPTYSENVYSGDIPPQTPIPSAPAATNKDSFITIESLQYELSTLQAATNNFSKDNIIGRGGFGIVYKGTLLDGREIAVKRLSNGSGQGDEELKTEVVFLAKLQHRNLVKLLGFCVDDDETLLVYEYVLNKSLDYILFDREKRGELNWSCRFEIIKGIARGMLYLHEDSPIRIIHRDLKAGNVLLDAKMRPKIADFGMAKICSFDQTHIDTSRVVGTYGYMAPEYLLRGQYSVNSDVYAFGVLVLEILSGRRISGSFGQSGGQTENLMCYAWRCWREENPLGVMDPTLKDLFSVDEAVKCIHLGLLCVQEDVSKRPTMSTIVMMLNSYSTVAAMPMPQHPSYLYNSNSDQSTTSTTITKSSNTVNSGAASSLSWSDFQNKI